MNLLANSIINHCIKLKWFVSISFFTTRLCILLNSISSAYHDIWYLLGAKNVYWINTFLYSLICLLGRLSDSENKILDNQHECYHHLAVVFSKKNECLPFTHQPLSYVKMLEFLKPDSLGDVSIELLNQRKNNTLQYLQLELIGFNPEQLDFLSPLILNKAHILAICWTVGRLRLC